MSLLTPLLALLALGAPPQGADGPSKAASVAPFVGEDVAVVVRFDLARWSGPASTRRVLGKLADDPEIADVASAFDARIEALKKAGAADLFLLVDPADMPGYPVAVVPLLGGVDARAVAALLVEGSPIRFPKAETIRGAVVAGTPEALTRLREARPEARPELAAALASAGDSAVVVALIPTIAQRRAIEESFPSLPPQAGGGPIEAVTRGVAWASVAMSTDPKATLRVLVRGRDTVAARGLRKIAEDALGFLVKVEPSMADLAGAVDRTKPSGDGEMVRLEADLEKTTALVAIPVLKLLEASRRRQSVDNLKQFGLAMHNYHATHKAFPAAFVAGKDGKPLLSWRVLILPYLEQKELFDQFHLDEPWDGPHNKALIGRMPRVYANPGGPKAFLAEGKTTYLAPRGPATIFPGAAGVKIQDVPDGTSNTILVAEVGDDLAVTWTKPDDWPVAPEFTTKGLFGRYTNGTNFGLGDGSVRFMKASISPAVLRALTTRNGGEALNPNDF